MKTPGRTPPDLPAPLLVAYPSLADLPARLRDELARRVTLLRLPAGSTLFRDGDACSGFPTVLSGRR